MVYTPVTGSVRDTASNDYYIDSTNCERWAYEYDTEGNLTALIAPSTAVFKEFAYDSFNRLTGARAGEGPWTAFGYASDAALYADEITGPEGLTTGV